MQFVLNKTEYSDYKDPIEMYLDNKLKSIMGPLNYQADLINDYMTHEEDANISFELPTGSGKTLVALLIAEFQRKVKKRKVIYLCPTKQLVVQVCTHAKEKYGITAIPFIQKHRDFLESDIKEFQQLNKIGVTTYSSFFAKKNSIFSDVDIIVMDDVHSSEEFIINNWTITINEDNLLFKDISLLLKQYISENDYYYLNNRSNELRDWVNLVPTPAIIEIKEKLLEKLRTIDQTEDASNYFAFIKMKDIIPYCNVYLSYGKIQIRPWIAPTMSFDPFKNAKQRIMMSATLGNCGELQRITGVSKITKLTSSNELKDNGIGRKFFVFPALVKNASQDTYFDLMKTLIQQAKKCICIVPTNNYKDQLTAFISNTLSDFSIIEIKDYELDYKSFAEKEKAVGILTNRCDGIDFPDDVCRLLFVLDLQQFTGSQERFISSKLGASVLLKERIKARIIQAVGRCTRNMKDYSLVWVNGDIVNNYLLNEKFMKATPAELRSEVKFGIQNSEQMNGVEDAIELATKFFEHGEEWKTVENFIVSEKKQMVNSFESSEYIQLSQIVPDEITTYMNIYSGNYNEAAKSCKKIIDIMTEKKLSGYRDYWEYVMGNISYLQWKESGDNSSRSLALRYYQNASKGLSGSLRWMSNLPKYLKEKVTEEKEDYFANTLINIEKTIASKRGQKLTNLIKEVEQRLNNTHGISFEKAHLDAWKLLGFNAFNDDGEGSPDPYWIIDSQTIIVTEDKLYTAEKAMSLKDVREAVSHQSWIKNNVKEVSRDAKIYTTVITTATEVDSTAKDIIREDIYYLNLQEFVKWLTNALDSIIEVSVSFDEIGDNEWRKKAHETFKKNNTLPSSLIELMTNTHLREKIK